MVTQATASPSNVRVTAAMRAAAVLLAVVGLDQLTKNTIAAGIGLSEQRKFLPGIHLVHVRNTGVAFGFFSGGGTLVLVFTFLALSVLVAYFLRRPNRHLLWLPTGLLVGGALGNLIDRLAHGAVTDFIKLPHWPAFNVADMAITFGVFALLWVLEGPREDARGRGEHRGQGDER
jgi:signal peptidase II